MAKLAALTQRTTPGVDDEVYATNAGDSVDYTVTRDVFLTNTPTAITTAGGAGTAIDANARWITVTSGGNNEILTLPAAVVGRVIKGYTADIFELRTLAASNDLINGVNADGAETTNEAAIPAASYFECTAVTTAAWLVTLLDSGGDVVTAPIPG